MRSTLRLVAGVLGRCLVAAVLLFPLQMPALTMAVLAALAIALATRRLLAATPFDSALAVLLLAVLAGAVASSSAERAIPKLTGVVLGMLTFTEIARHVRTRTQMLAVTGVYLLAGAGLIAVGATATYWSTSVLPEGLSLAIPRFIGRLPGTSPEGVNQNALGGTTLFFLPLLLTLVARGGALARDHAGWPRLRRGVTSLLQIVLAVVLLEMAAVLALSNSQSAWIGGVAAATGLLLLLVFDGRGLRRLTLGAAVVLLCLAGWRWSTAVSGPLPGVEWVRLQVKQTYRGELWARGLTVLADHPWTGVGLGAFRDHVDGYPIVVQELTRHHKRENRLVSFDVAHAHNTFLQVALDSGVVGLAAYLAVLLIAAVIAGRSLRAGDTMTRVLGLGLSGNIVAIHVFGLTDAIALGAKVGIFLWASLGLLAALHHIASPQAMGSARTRIETT